MYVYVCCVLGVTAGAAMPEIKLQNISTFSSEDANHPARNLLSSDTYRKWKCATGGEKQAVIVFEVSSIWNNPLYFTPQFFSYRRQCRFVVWILVSGAGCVWY